MEATECVFVYLQTRAWLRKQREFGEAEEGGGVFYPSFWGEKRDESLLLIGREKGGVVKQGLEILALLGRRPHVFPGCHKEGKMGCFAAMMDVVIG